MSALDRETSAGMDADELDLFRVAIERATTTASGADLDGALAELGWSDALAADERAAVATLFEAQGASASSSGALSAVILSALGCDGSDATAVLLPRLGTAAAPGPPFVVGARRWGIGLGELRHRPQVVVAAQRAGSTWVTTVAVADLDTRPVTGIDPDAELVEVRLDDLDDSCTWEPTRGSWTDAVAAARRALAHEQVGAMRTMLGLACDHARERIQFGQPIATFQAVRHRLAEALVAVEAAEAALDGAWLDGSPFTAAVAKAVAGTSARTVRRHTQQVLAGIGFTTEHDLHRFLRRSIVVDALFGDALALTDEIGAQLIEAGRLPDLLAL